MLEPANAGPFETSTFKMMIPESPDLTYLSAVRARTVGSLLAIVGVLVFAATGAMPSSRAAAASPQSASSAPSSVSEVRPLLDRYCVTCHNQRLKTAGLELDRLDPGLIGEHVETWEKVVRRLRTGSMPPAGSRRPDQAGYKTMADALESALDQVAARAPNPGRPSVHRLNRAEYANAVRDLLGVSIDPRTYLPADDSGYGFDNIADVLSVSPGLLDRYLVAAGRIARLAVADASIRPDVAKYRVPLYYAQEDRAGEELPFGSRGGLAVHHHFPADGEYVVKVVLQRIAGDIVRGIGKPRRLEVRLDRARVKEFTLGGQGRGMAAPATRPPDADLEVRFSARAGTRLVAAAFVQEPMLDEGVFQPRLPIASFAYWTKVDTEPAIDTIEIRGPYNPTSATDIRSWQNVFVCRPASAQEEGSCARTILSTLARRAYRRPIGDSDVAPLMRFYQAGREKGDFNTGIGWAIERILVDPEFLFRIERPPANVAPGTTYLLSDLELASRLSFFLWSSVPDDELLRAAAEGRLKDPRTLEQQIARMLADERSQALVENFAGQWLWQRNMRTHAPDTVNFPDFDENLREAFQTETQLFLESQLRDDRPVTELLSADYTFVNERLARHYGYEGVYGSHFRRVSQPDPRRAGLLGQGSVLTVTSYAHRTSPVVRGKWLLENILGAPPPPPPANIPALRENDEKGKPTSVRERLEEHRNNPICSSCHSRMDPLGFALENFDATGKWRTVGEGGSGIDASGTLPDGTRFNGPAEFRAALLAHRDEFVGTLAEKLLTYAIGRGVEYYDMPEVRKILKSANAKENRWSALILGVVNSTPFRMSVVPQQAAANEARR
jgi:hypothetical protein